MILISLWQDFCLFFFPFRFGGRVIKAKKAIKFIAFHFEGKSLNWKFTIKFFPLPSSQGLRARKTNVWFLFLGTKKMEYKTRQWHEKCFCCCVCKTPIGTKSFIPREQDIFCAGCYEEKFATRCVKCRKVRKINCLSWMTLQLFFNFRSLQLVVSLTRTTHGIATASLAHTVRFPWLDKSSPAVMKNRTALIASVNFLPNAAQLAPSQSQVIFTEN